MAAITMTGVTKHYGKQQVLAGLDLEIEAGRIFALLGPNGAGKTTTVRILSTLLKADKGVVTVAGFDVDSQRADARRRLRITGQEAALDLLQTGTENLMTLARLSGFRRDAARVRANELLEEFDLIDAAGKTVATYSGGMRRRLDVAATLLTRPIVLFLDEPTTGLDPRSRQAVWDVVRRQSEQGTTVFLTTQYLGEADALASDVAILDAGRLIARGSPIELKARFGEARLHLSAKSAEAAVLLHNGLQASGFVCAQSGLQITLATDGTSTHVRSALHAGDPDDQLVERLEIVGATLDDVFLALTGRSSAADAQEEQHHAA